MTVSAAPVLPDGLVDDDDLDDALLNGVLEGMATSAAPPPGTMSAGVPSEGHRGEHASIHPGSIALGEDRGEARDGKKGTGRFVPPLGGSDDGGDDVDFESDAFAKELAAGMEELMRDLAAAESSSAATHGNRSATPFTATASSSSKTTNGDKTRSGGLSAQEQQDELIAAFQAFMGQVSQTEESDNVDTNSEETGNAHATHAPVSKTACNGPSSAARTSATAGGNSFQDRIRMTMDKLKDSSDQAGAAQGPTGGLEGGADMDTLMAEMMQQMDALADSNELDSVLEGMMQSLLSKGILQEPLTELATKYPAYLETHRDTLPAEQLEKYRQQHALIQRILDLYQAGQEEAEGKQIVSLMTQIQELGQAPPELLKELSPDLEMDMKTGLPAFPSATGAAGAPGECTVM